MAKHSPIQAAMLKALRPEINKRKPSIEGSVMAVNYYDNTARIYWRDPESGAARESENVPLPADGDGVFRQAIEAGDRVTLAFRHGNHMNPYVTTIQKVVGKEGHQSRFGAGVPKGISFF